MLISYFYESSYTWSRQFTSFWANATTVCANPPLFQITSYFVLTYYYHWFVTVPPLLFLLFSTLPYGSKFSFCPCRTSAHLRLSWIWFIVQSSRMWIATIAISRIIISVSSCKAASMVKDSLQSESSKSLTFLIINYTLICSCEGLKNYVDYLCMPMDYPLPAKGRSLTLLSPESKVSPTYLTPWAYTQFHEDNWFPWLHFP